MFPADQDPVPTVVEYDSRGSRAVRLLPDQCEAQRLFVKAEHMGLHPSFSRSDSMSTVETTPVVPSTEKTFKKTVKKAAKPVAKKKNLIKGKAAVAKPEPKKASVPRGDSIRLRTFQLLNKHPNGLTGAQIKERLELGGIPSLLKDEGCAATPRIKRQTQENVRGVVYVLSAAGRKALEKDTVDSDTPEKAAGQEWPANR